MFDISDGKKSYYSKYYLELVKIKFLLYYIRSTLFGVTSLNLLFLHIEIHKYLGVFSVTLLTLALSVTFKFDIFKVVTPERQALGYSYRMVCEMCPI